MGETNDKTPKEELSQTNLESKEKKYEGKAKYVKEQIEKLGLWEIVEQSEELFDRLVLLHQEKFSGDPEKDRNEKSHFEDSIEIAHIIERLMMADEEKQYSQEDIKKMKLISLVHDIGKSGPAELSEEEQNEVSLEEAKEAVSFLFSVDFVRDDIGKINEIVEDREVKRFDDIPLGQAVKRFGKAEKKEFGKAENEKIVKKIYKIKCPVTGQFFDENMPISYLWRSHAYWTRDILAQTEGKVSGIDDEVKKIASSHHLGEILYKNEPIIINPMDLDLQKEIKELDKIGLISVVDMYQAFVKRSKKNWPKALAIIEKEKIRENPNLADSEIYKNGFLKILKLIKKNPEI